MARILVVGINYAPENIGTGKYSSEMCEWLAARGHQVRVITAPPYYPAWKIWKGFSAYAWKREQRNGVELIRCPLWVPSKPSGLTRLLHLASFGTSSLPALLASVAWKPDLVLNIAPTLASAPGAWLTAKLARAKCWLHIQDFELDAALEMGIVNAGPAKRFAAACERWLLGAFDRVSTISEKMQTRLGEKGVLEARQVAFPNWANIASITPLRTPSRYRSQLGVPEGAVVALYSGNMGLKQGLDVLGDAARALSDQDCAKRVSIHFVFGGEGPARELLEQSCHGLGNVHFLGLQPVERLNDWLGLADIHLLPQRADVADLVMPSKLTGMLASGRPVLATAYPETGVANALVESGVVTPPGDVSAFVTALGRLAESTSLRTALGENARKQAVTTLSRDSILALFEQHVSELLGTANAAGTASKIQTTQDQV
ncbi:MAG: glycosyltransferase WbuB [Luteimonas sp.]